MNETPDPILPPLELSYPLEWVIAGSIIFGILVIALVYWGYRTFQRSRKTQKNSGVPVQIDEDKIALEKIKQLERQVKEKLASPEGFIHFKKVYFQLSELMKEYFGKRFQFDALESTSSELMGALQSKNVLHVAHLDQVEILFQKLDRVKFTDHIPESAEYLGLLDQSRQLVLGTCRVTNRATQGTKKLDGGNAIS